MQSIWCNKQIDGTKIKKQKLTKQNPTRDLQTHQTAVRIRRPKPFFWQVGKDVKYKPSLTI